MTSFLRTGLSMAALLVLLTAYNVVLVEGNPGDAFSKKINETGQIVSKNLIPPAPMVQGGAVDVSKSEVKKKSPSPQTAMEQGEETVESKTEATQTPIIKVAEPAKDGFIKEILGGFNYNIKALFFESYQALSNSTINPKNVLDLPRINLQFELRPDFYLNYGRLRLSALPRFTFSWLSWEDGLPAGETDEDADVYLNEWLASFEVFKSLFVSYSRENLQWGPSYLVSPSNPFFIDNGRSNPKVELGGMDFARLIWVPSSSWSISFIANIDEGEQDYLSDDFEPIYALKLDATGYRKYLSLIASYRETDRARLGAFAGWTITDGLLLYAEGDVAEGTSALYPVETSVIIAGEPVITFEPTQDESDDLETLSLLGASYTFEAGPTLALEFVLNTAGYDDKDAERALKSVEQATRLLLLKKMYGLPFPIEITENDILFNNRLRLLRKHYAMLQFNYANIYNVLHLAFRYTYNIDDNSSQLIPILQYDIGDHTQLFIIGNQNFGSQNTEFRLFVDTVWTFGIQVSF
jgi:hypothetical protein